MVRVGLIGAGKMGISHLSILGAHPEAAVVAVCDNTSYVTSGLKKYTGIETFKDYKRMIETSDLDCVFVATPTQTHFEVARFSIERGVAVFVEKPLSLSPQESKELARLASDKNVVTQVGYHNRFIGTFREAKRLISEGAIGEIYHVDGSAFGQVVVRPKTGKTWRASKKAGGGCLHDYASHVVDLMNFVVGPPEQIVGAHLKQIFSDSVEDAVYATMLYANGASGQLETNWSDETYRKMSTTLVVYGTKGKIVVDRQECRVFLRAGNAFEDYEEGWTIRYITDLQPPVDFYLRGEEYSEQIDHFLDVVARGDLDGENSFARALETDLVIDRILEASV